MQQVDVLSAVRTSNDSRTSSNQAYIGALFFLVALGMVQYACSVALIQAYVLPMRRFEHVSSVFASTKLVALIYAIVLNVSYFLIAATGGMTGFIVSSSVLILWTGSLVIVGSIRRWIRYTEPAIDQEDDEDESDLSVSDERIPTIKSVNSSLHKRQIHAHAEKVQPAPPVQNGVAKRPAPRTASKRAFVFRRLRRTTDPWTSSPTPMKSAQLGCIFVSTAALLANVMTILLIVYLWDIDDYQLVTPNDVALDEVMPPLTAKALQFMYAYPEFAQKMQLDVYTKLFTEYCGATYTWDLVTHQEKVDSIQTPWIDGYQVNMSEAVRKNLDDYTSVNDWFTRTIDMSLRPLPNISRVVTSPADSRVSAFQTISQSRTFFKGYDLNYKTLINNVAVNGDSDYFLNGVIVIFRMAPQDYHRFHMPVNGTIASVTALPGTLWSVGNDAVGSGNSVFLNQRTLIIINTTTIGTVALVAIGATCVGSVLVQLEDGTPIVKGMSITQGTQIGLMQFGGSTVVLLFRSNAVSVDGNIIFRSTFPVETLVRVNQEIAAF